MTDRLRELAGKIDKATPGLWGWNGRDFVGPISKEDDQSYGMVLPVLELEYRDEKQANAEAICLARNECPDLLREAADEIERLQRVVKEAREFAGFYVEGDKIHCNEGGWGYKHGHPTLAAELEARS